MRNTTSRSFSRLTLYFLADVQSFLALFTTFGVQKDDKITFAGGVSEQGNIQQVAQRATIAHLNTSKYF